MIALEGLKASSLEITQDIFSPISKPSPVDHFLFFITFSEPVETTLSMIKL